MYKLQAAEVLAISIHKPILEPTQCNCSDVIRAQRCLDGQIWSAPSITSSSPPSHCYQMCYLALMLNVTVHTLCWLLSGLCA